MKPVYPLAAVVGQDTFKQALLLVAINPGVGGLLVRGEKGTAKYPVIAEVFATVPVEFLPVLTESRHHLVEPAFAQAIDGWCAQERAAVRRHRDTLLAHSPFRHDDPAAAAG